MSRVAVAQTATQAVGESSIGLLQRKCDCGNKASILSGECAECQGKNMLGLQTKLQVGDANDQYEREADSVAESVMRMPEPLGNASDQYLRAKPLIQRRVADQHCGVSAAPPSVHVVLRSPGRPLDKTLRDFMEPRFGHDFSKVRIHSDRAAAESANSVNAKAYTVGQNIVFGRGQYSSETDAGRLLLAHELTHVVQQNSLTGNLVQRDLLENDPGTAPAMTCPLANTSVAGHQFSINFSVGGSTLSTNDKDVLAGFANEWNLSPVQPTVRVDGFASIDGGPEQNWPLSCDRALAVAAELHAPSVGGRPGIPTASIEYFANGETERFSTSLAGNRVAAIHAPGMALPTSREPSVHHWVPRNSGAASPDNCAPLAPGNFGVDCDPPKFKNGIELAVHIRDHDPSFTYDIKRTKETKYHRTRALPLGLSGNWETVASLNKPAGSDDDRHNSDECLTPIASGSLHKIYAVDRPGFKSMTSSTYNAYLQKINFIESVRVTRPDGSTYDSTNTQRWHTHLLLERSAGRWSINTRESEIDTGHLSSLDP